MVLDSKMRPTLLAFTILLTSAAAVFQPTDTVILNEYGHSPPVYPSRT